MPRVQEEFMADSQQPDHSTGEIPPGQTPPDNDDGALAREDEDDYDLLTFGEAGARLDQEVRRLARSVAELEKSAADDDHELQRSRARLEALLGAQARNARQPINDENFTKFFGYEGKARRNTG
ncbi:MAG: hypothetical protein JWM76_3956 [Pseudonocardiales bacterium]|nr:hypothetical protein [Pseudonocardiales bacterium]